MKTVPRPTTSSVRRGWNESSMSMLAPGQEAQVRREREPVDVEQRQDVDQDVVGREPPAVLQRVQAGGEVGVRVHDPLGPAGRARAVEHQAWGIVRRWRVPRNGLREHPRPRCRSAERAAPAARSAATR